MTLLHQAAQKAVEAKQREAFEHWYSDAGRWPKSVARGEDGHYLLAQTNSSYEAWRAALSTLQQQPEPVAEDDPTHWKQNYFNLRHVMQDWHAQALTARFDGVPDVLLVAAEAANLFSALNAMLTQFGMDEDEWSRPTFKQAKSAIEQYLAARKKTADAPALQHQEEPREPVDTQAIFMAQHKFLEWNRAQSEPLVKIAYEYGAFAKAIELYCAASPSTTRQQEVGIGFWWCAQCQCEVPSRSVTYEETHDVRAGGCGHPVGDIPAAPSTPEKAGGVSDGVGGNDGVKEAPNAD